MNELIKYLQDNLIDFDDFDKDAGIIAIKDFGSMYFVEPKDDIIIEPGFELNLHDVETEAPVNYFCFEFGEKYYYTKANEELQLIPLKYIGKSIHNTDFSLPLLGLHGGYELLNGSRDYSDWIKKAKFLNVNTLGICEKNTLAGALKFQLACKKAGIKSIIGEQVVVKDGVDFVQFKCYAKNSSGWSNLLSLNRSINVDNHGFVPKDVFLKHTEGLFIVIDTKYTSYRKSLPYDLNLEELYYQIDTVEFASEEKDKEYLLNLKSFIDQSTIKPVLINDAYYLDKDEYRAKQILNGISNARDYKSSNQYFKTFEETFDHLTDLFNDQDKGLNVIYEGLQNLEKISQQCNFKIETGVKYLPKYKMTKEEVEKYGDKDSMFWALIEEGLTDKVINKGKDLNKYLERIQEEYEVISLVTSDYGDGVDYFLMSWDIIRFCHKQNILVGLARGSSAGSAIAFLMNIVKIDPFDYGLLFSRFLNKGRVEKGSLSDFDIDFETLRRDEVKHYLEEKYGHNNICNVGTYTTLQLKAALKDRARQDNIEFETVNYVSQKLEDVSDLDDLFKLALEKPAIKKFILDYPDIIEDLYLILKQPKSNSIHACAMIVVPDDKEIYQHFPVRSLIKDEEEMIVSEWDGTELEIAGFLKVDILGVRQLDKYRFIVDLIKENTGEEIDIYNIPLNEKGVFELFQEGNNGDIFQLGTRGISSYSKEIKPENISEVINTVALYRPGAMDVNAHNEYVLRKFEEREVAYPWGCEEILKDTYGLIVFQEQVMQIVQQLADFDEVTADDVRRAIGKKKKEIIDRYKEQFLSVVIKKGCPEQEANRIWHELEVHAGYSFNLSHSTAYGITGYIGQWLKYHHPLEFWTSAFQFDNPDPKKSNISRYIAEINRTDSFIKIVAPHINESKDIFTSNYKKMELYWSIDKVKQVGPVALESIINERDKNGEFFGLEDFLSRVEKSTVNKAVVINLILSGSFDELEELKGVGDRKILIDKYYEVSGTKRDKDDIYLQNHEDFFWQLKQKEIGGFGSIDYKKIIKKETGLNIKNYVPAEELIDKEDGASVVISGIIKDFSIRTTKNKDEFCRITIDNNNQNIEIALWNETFSQLSVESIQTGAIIALNGRVADYRNEKNIHSTEKTKVYFIV